MLAIGLSFASGSLFGGSLAVRGIGYAISAKYAVAAFQQKISLIKFDKIQKRFDGKKENDFESQLDKDNDDS